MVNNDTEHRSSDCPRVKSIAPALRPPLSLLTISMERACFVRRAVFCFGKFMELGDDRTWWKFQTWEICVYIILCILYIYVTLRIIDIDKKNDKNILKPQVFNHCQPFLSQQGCTPNTFPCKHRGDVPDVDASNLDEYDDKALGFWVTLHSDKPRCRVV